MTTPTLPDFPVDTYNTPLPVAFTPPPLNPTTFGLYGAVGTWQPDDQGRWRHGVDFRPGGNYGGAGSFGVWAADWCASPGDLGPDDIKTGTRPAGLDPFGPVVVWAYDECDLTEPSRADVQARVAQVLRLEEQVAVERELAGRLLLDAAELPGVPATATSLAAAVGALEAAAALTNTVAYFHIGAQWVSQDASAGQLFKRSGTTWTSPLGNVWVVGGGYVDGLENHIVATSQPYGWRDEPVVRTAIDQGANTFAAVAERTVLVGYEALVAAVEIVP
ncbi:hypothetical protein A5719_10290 [Mycolicibacterium peregrinum]|uniref:hypothetical protein n=1 Tax=Mycolicibacterium peregrinum TaxID=43304 RepID=UPI0007EBB576|nr:hypothetical protein [Mycolicibacterium peregrinum]OBF42823.1 hypothetical protein A5719_10290 [Mycolicibacterium peregrinum]